MNDRREGIRTLTALIEAGRDPEGLDPASRLNQWRGDLAAVAGSGADPELLEVMRLELDRLEALLA